MSLWFLQHVALKAESLIYWLWWCGVSVRKCYKICSKTLCLSGGFNHTYVERNSLSTYVTGSVMGRLITKPDVINLLSSIWMYRLLDSECSRRFCLQLSAWQNLSFRRRRQINSTLKIPDVFEMYLSLQFLVGAFFFFCHVMYFQCYVAVITTDDLYSVSYNSDSEISVPIHCIL
jgi:hypothetical protein